MLSMQSSTLGGRGGGVTWLILAGHVPLASQNPYPILVDYQCNPAVKMQPHPAAQHIPITD